MRLFTAVQIQTTLQNMVPEFRGSNVEIKDNTVYFNGEFLTVEVDDVDDELGYTAQLKLPNEQPAKVISDNLEQLFSVIAEMV